MMFLFLIIGMYACESDENLIMEPGMFKVKGIIELQGTTIYQYGSYIIKTEDDHFVIQSDVYDLDEYISQEVTVVGSMMPGPVSYGPPIIDVVDIE